MRVGWGKRFKRYVTVSDAYAPAEPAVPVEAEPAASPAEREQRQREFAAAFAAEAVRQARQNAPITLASKVIGGLGWLGAGLSVLAVVLSENPFSFAISLLTAGLFVCAGWNGSNLLPMFRGDEPIVARKIYLGWRFLGAAVVVGLFGICVFR